MSDDLRSNAVVQTIARVALQVARRDLEREALARDRLRIIRGGKGGRAA